MTYYIGIDPGTTGALAVVDEKGRFCEIYDLPIKFKLDVMDKKRKKVINGHELYNILCAIIAEYDIDICVYLEDVIGRGGWQVSTSFSMGETIGSIRAIVDKMGIKLQYINSQKWKKKLNLTKDKEQVRAYTIKLYPEARPYLDRVKDHNRAEALLIARYGALYGE